MDPEKTEGKSQFNVSLEDTEPDSAADDSSWVEIRRKPTDSETQSKLHAAPKPSMAAGSAGTAENSSVGASIPLSSSEPCLYTASGMTPPIPLPVVGESLTVDADECDEVVELRHAAVELGDIRNDEGDEEEELTLDDVKSKVDLDWVDDPGEVMRQKKLVLRSLRTYFRKLIDNAFPKPSAVKAYLTATKVDTRKTKRRGGVTKRSVSAPDPGTGTPDLLTHLRADLGKDVSAAEIAKVFRNITMVDLLKVEELEAVAQEKETQDLSRKKATVMSNSPLPIRISKKQTSESETQQDGTIRRSVEVKGQPHKLKLLKEPFSGYTACKITINDDFDGGVTFEGSEEAVQEAKRVFDIQLNKLAEDRKDFSQAMTSIFRSPMGHKYISEVTAAHNGCAVHVGATFVLCAAFERSDVRNCLMELERDVRTEPLELARLSQSDMRRLRQQVEGEYLVRLLHNGNDEGKVTLEGVEQDVDIAASWLLKQDEDYQKDMDIFLLKGEARAKCFKNCFKDKLDEVKEIIRSNDGSYEEKLENDRYLLTYHARQGLMEEIGARLRMIRASIWENTIDLKEEFPDTTDQWLLLEGLRKNDVKNFEATFERNVGGQCFVHIKTASKKWGSTRRIQGNEKKGATPKKLNPVMNFFYTGRLKSAPFSKSVIIHNTRVTVVCGDISRTTADVLVSPIGKELDMSKTAVGKALLKRFGSSVQTDLSTLESHPGDVIETVLSPDNAGGQVNVTAIYHARLAQFPPPDDSKKVKTVVKTCLALAEENRCKTIAFPLLGCGRKFKLPFDTVMSAMINATRGALSKMSSETSLQLVTFVLRSVREAQIFAQHLDELAPCPADLPTHTPHHEDKDWLLETLTTPTPTQTMEGVHLSCGLFGSSRNVLSSMRARLVQELRQTFLYEDSVEHAGLLQLSESATTQIRRAGTFESVAIARLAAGGSCLRLKGEHHAVLKVKELIQSNLLQLPVYSTSTLSSQADRRPYHPPAYWRIAASQALMDEALQSAYKLTPVSDEERTAIENLVQATFDRRLVTAGRDAIGLRHTAISVKQVERVENPALFETYRSRRNHLLRQCEHNGKRCPPVGSIEQYSSGHVMTTALLTAGNPLLRELHLDVNEHYLFHGTHLENLQAILHHGADARLADSSGMLGSGIYFGEAFTKSDRYTDDRSKRAYGEKTVLLMRVLLGTPYFSKLIKPTKFRRPPCRKCKKDRCSEDHGGSFGFFDSVIDDCTSFRAFREFVVYDSTMCYPEYVITYTREG